MIKKVLDSVCSLGELRVALLNIPGGEGLSYIVQLIRGESL